MPEEYEDIALLKQEIISIVQKCVRCRFCFSQCPVYEVSNQWMTSGASGLTQSLYYGLVHDRLDEDLRDILAQCTTCGACETICHHLMAGVDLVEAITKGRQLLMTLEVSPLPEQQKVLESLQNVANPYAKSPAGKNDWAREMGVPFVEDDPEAQVLYYVGCTTAYDERVRRAAQALVTVMQKAGVSCGVLRNEKCCGDVPRVMGEDLLFDLMSQELAEQLGASRAPTMVTGCPHGFNALLNDYPPELAGGTAIQHHTQYLWELINTQALELRESPDGPLRVTYHDPCYLGRHAGVYEEPRQVLASLPGVELVEMARNRDKGLCCGGGGGRMWLDLPAEKRLNEVRVLEALEVGAQVLVSACPFCLVNFEDAIKSLQVGDKIRTMDIAELTVNYL